MWNNHHLHSWCRGKSANCGRVDVTKVIGVGSGGINWPTVLLPHPLSVSPLPSLLDISCQAMMAQQCLGTRGQYLFRFMVGERVFWVAFAIKKVSGKVAWENPFLLLCWFCSYSHLPQKLPFPSFGSFQSVRGNISNSTQSLHRMSTLRIHKPFLNSVK